MFTWNLQPADRQQRAQSDRCKTGESWWHGWSSLLLKQGGPVETAPPSPSSAQHDAIAQALSRIGRTALPTRRVETAPPLYIPPPLAGRQGGHHLLRRLVHHVRQLAVELLRSTSSRGSLEATWGGPRVHEGRQNRPSHQGTSRTHSVVVYSSNRVSWSHLEEHDSQAHSAGRQRHGEAAVLERLRLACMG